jgi:DnaK suppressor protein
MIDPDTARSLIDQERKSLQTLVQERENEGLREAEGEQLSELAAYDQHQADLGTETFEREKDFSLLEQLEAELDDLDRALQKVEAGTYGVCESCEQDIAAERLETLPGARLCVSCQSQR